ncbi:MAG: UDP-N-acetylglucosamine 1-carboxyvinyltransferase [Oscillospiraceae bacterium]|nr:UDP-N-acetylglucosamine 1-carboxyvinyltransferase [Oscillospiraceae bacterium]
MAKYIVEGGRRLDGEVEIHGAKNAVLPILAATLLVGKSTILNCPSLSDVAAACAILEHLGARVTKEADRIEVLTDQLTSSTIPEHLMREMRSSVVFLGAIIARCGKARVSMPGGCELGPRPIDLHLSAFEKLGVKIEEDHGYLECTVPDKLRGANITLDFPSVGATENIMLAACTALGETVIHNPAREPEIVDLAAFLQKAGAKIEIGENGTIYIQGVPDLVGVEHRVIPDRIEAATYLCCAAITGGRVVLREVIPSHMNAIFPILEEAGCGLAIKPDTIVLHAPKRILAPKMIRTMPYPGFPTDAQSPLMAVSCVAEGSTIFIENIFENRYKQAGELARMGAKVKVEGRVAVVEGVPKLHGAELVSTDLRGGAALTCAALSAEGVSQIKDIYHIERGYQDFDKNLKSLGAIMETVDD